MASKRDWLLQTLGITQWLVRCPNMLQNEAKIIFSPEIRLLIIERTTLPRFYSQLFYDVLRSLRLTPAQTYILTLGQISILPENIKCNSWRIGIKDPISVPGLQIYSPPLADLAKNPQAKRVLWQQIYHNEKYFYSNKI